MHYEIEALKTQIALYGAQNIRIREDNQRLRETNNTLFCLNQFQRMAIESFRVDQKTLKSELKKEKEQSTCFQCYKRFLTVFLHKGICVDCITEQQQKEMISKGFILCDCCSRLVPPNDLTKIKFAQANWDICQGCKNYKEAHFTKEIWSIELMGYIQEDYSEMEQGGF